VVGIDQNKLELLGRLPLFATLTGEELADVAEVAEPAHFASGDVVFREGDYSNSCYVITAGHAAAVREHRDGRAITLARFGPGDLFGELAMLDDQRRSATIKALDELDVVAIGGPEMRRLLREHPDIAVKLINTLAQKLRRTNERLAGQSFQTVQSRVAKALAGLVEAARVEGTSGDDIVIRTTQAELARLAGSSRESASRFLAVLERAEIITQGRGRLTVHDPAALDRYVY
jgi:CRP/FNR family transcriptional regulator, cyclic AMP receptor protein